MEGESGRESVNLCDGGTGTSSSTGTGTENHQKSLDWNLNDYAWNNNLFLASQLNPTPSNCSLKQSNINSDKKRRISSPIEEEEENEERISSPVEEGINLDRSVCQVDGCGADLTVEKDYHRRHRVCSNHSKARSVSINGEIKRFCQQCSKFHNLEEFDEGRRSCRRRLDKHNGRRRKRNNQNATHNNNILNGNQANTIIITLLKLITNLESNKHDKQNDILNISAILQRIQQNDQNAPDPNNLNNINNIPSSSNSQPKFRNFDLNDEYFEQDQQNEDQIENQSRTGKIIFKLFGKDPKDSPPNLRPEILKWLSNYPTEMESYIKPGCIILTLYLRLNNSIFQDLARNLGYHIERLIHINPKFWGSGFIYTIFEDQILFLQNGRIILEGPLNFEDQNRIKIVNINPISVPLNSKVTFCIKGLNFSKSNARLFCVFDGKYLVRESVRDLVVKDEKDGTINDKEECLTFSCFVPACTGRGFIEIEEFDHSGFSFPFIITDKSSCLEIRALESETLEKTLNPLYPNSLHFLQEFGWILNRSRLNKIEIQNPKPFHIIRIKYLINFILDKEWCNVLKTLLDIIINGDLIINGEEFILDENILFEAVRRKSEKLVNFLLRYKINEKYIFVPDMEIKNNIKFGNEILTPIHLAANLEGMESILDALTQDPQKIGIRAWLSSRGTSGTNKTPKEIAVQKGQNSYILLLQSKINSLSKPVHHLMPAPKHHFDLETGLGECRICFENKNNKMIYKSNRVLKNRMMVLSLVCVGAVCVCVALILKTPPFVKFTKGPFLWDNLQGGSM